MNSIKKLHDLVGHENGMLIAYCQIRILQFLML